MSESLTNDALLWTILLAGLGIVIKNWYDSLYMQQILHTVLLLVYGLAILSAFLLVLYLLLRHGQKNKEHINDFKSSIASYEREYANLVELKEAQHGLDNYLRWQPFLVRHYPLLINKSKRHFLVQKHKLQLQIEKAEQRRIRAERAEQKEREKIEKLYEYFKKRNSCKSIPAWASSYSQSMVKNAISWFKDDEDERCERQQKERHRQEDKQKARRFVRAHNGLPVDFANCDDEERADYLEALQLNKEHKLTIDEPINEEIDFDDDERRFYHANKLKALKREELLRKHGYRHKAFIKLDGKRGNNLIIKNDTRKESDYHFCLKHLFAELDPEQAEIEYGADDKRADVVFHLPQNKLLAVEIETGTNKELATQKKVEWLNAAFDNWMIVCSRHNKQHYKKYVNNKKSYCLTVKHAAEKINQLLARPARIGIIKPAVA
ncbi:MAG: hypothetical protein V1725_06740, partial [archaeon]